MNEVLRTCRVCFALTTDAFMDTHMEVMHPEKPQAEPVNDDWLCHARLITDYQYQEGHNEGKTEERNYIAKRLKDAYQIERKGLHWRALRDPLESLFRAAGLED